MRTASNIHAHTPFSDGRDPAEALVNAALTLGFHTLGFSEHGPAEYDGAAMPAESMRAYFAEIERLRAAYAGRIALLIGLEHDWYAPLPAEPFDYTIESVHYLRVGGGYLGVDYRRGMLEQGIREHFGGDPYAMCREYFRTVNESIEGTGAKVIGHIELVMKFNEARDMFDDADPRYLGPALETAELAARSGRLVEVNTGAVARGLRTQPYPGAAMLKRICECGGRVIINSDCHTAAHMACGFDEAAGLLRACGFKTAWEMRGAQETEYTL